MDSILFLLSMAIYIVCQIVLNKDNKLYSNDKRLDKSSYYWYHERSNLEYHGDSILFFERSSMDGREQQCI